MALTLKEFKKTPKYKAADIIEICDHNGVEIQEYESEEYDNKLVKYTNYLSGFLSIELY